MTTRQAIIVRGTVQGVGFRPHVFTLASRLGLGGFVQNRAGAVVIEVEGTPDSLAQFISELSTHPPPLARIDTLTREPREPIGETAFRIVPSDTTAAEPVFIPPDVATCEPCIVELLDPADRRYRYPFLNCVNCGPRLTIIHGAPYDRSRTTMAAFPMCAACRAEYDDPTNRRFHAQPIACPTCGPRLQLRDARGQVLEVPDPLAGFVAAIREGRIGAMKGLGGYHLVCDGQNRAAVAELRRRKQRDEKPFAVMAADIPTVRALCEFTDAERLLLESPRRPIVLLRIRPTATLAHAVAPGNPWLGVMLPYSGLHHLLVRECEGTPLVMTSGNRTDEPIAYTDGDAVTQLNGIADVFLTHDRAIHVRCDDSVTRVVAGTELPLRRSRGYAPQAIPLPFECPQPILAVGGQLKSTFALGRGRHAILSHHLGDLDELAAARAFVRDIALYEELFGVRPAIVAHDLHPDYTSTRHALERRGVRSVAVQHHHAHMASCMAEHGLTEPVIGVCFDGTGYGTDGTVWGGEFLTGDYRAFRRVAHLRTVRMPGGEQTVREPWRMALAHLADAGVERAIPHSRVPETAQRTIRTMLERGLNAPWTSSAGRLFDAVAAIAGVRDKVSYEGQAAAELEWLAASVPADRDYPFELAWDEPANGWEIDTRPLIQALADDQARGTAAAVIARRFHTTLVGMIAAVCDRIRRLENLQRVVLGGGVFLNALLTEEATSRLMADGFAVHRHQLVPPSDGGLSLGQLAVAANR